MEVEIIISPDGTSKIEVNGAQGTQCEDITEALKKNLGGETISDVKKPEYYDIPADKVPDQVKAY